MSKKKQVQSVLYQVMCWGIGLAIISPILYAFSISFMNQREILSKGLHLLPNKLQLDNYKEALRLTHLVRYMMNSLILAGGSSLVRVAVASLSAFAFAFFEFKGKNFLFMLCMSTMMIPGDVVLITNYKTVAAWHLTDTYLGMMVVFLVSVLNIFMFRQFYLTFSKELYEASKVDGCSNIHFFTSILLPLSKPVMIKLVVTDVDGTIVGKDEILHEEMISFVKELRKKGILYTIATGRVDGLVRDYVEKLGLELPYVACNGGTVMQGDGVLVRKTIPLWLLKPVIEKADVMGMSVMYSLEGVETAYRETPYVMDQQEKFNRYHNPKSFSREEWGRLQVDKIIVMAAVRDGSIGVIEELLKELGETIGYKRYADKAIDIMNPEAAKENGVRELAKRLGIPMEQVLFAGDDLNDIQSIREAGIGVAVANAQDCVKEAADYVTVKPCYEGVMEAVRKFALGGECL